MMAVDPEISLGIKPPVSSLTGDPLGTISAIQGIQNAQNQLKNFAATFSAKQKAGQIIASAPNLASGLDAASKDPDVMGFAGDVYNTAREAQLAQVRVAGEQQNQATEGFRQFTKSTPELLTSPQSFGPNADAALALVSPAVRPRVASAIANTREALMAGLPDPATDPVGYQSGLTKNIVSTSLGVGGFGADTLHGIVGTPAQINVGDKIVPGTVAPVQGGPASMGSPAGGSFSPSGGALGLGLSPSVVPITGPTGSTTPTLLGGRYGTPGGGGAGPAAANPIAPSGQLPPVPASLLKQLATPAGGGSAAAGIPLGPGSPTTTAAAQMTARGGDMAQYQKGLDEAVTSGNTLLQTLGEANDAFGQIKTGGGAQNYAKLAEFAQAFGAPKTLVDQIGNGNLGATQEFQKLMVDTTTSRIKQQLGGMAGGHLGQQEFETFNQSNPNLSTDPRAIQKIFKFWTQVYNRNSDEQQSLNKYLSTGGDISSWPAEWQKQSIAKGYINPTGTGAKASGRSLQDIFSQ